MYRAEQRAQKLEKVEALKSEWHTSTDVIVPVNLVDLNPSRLLPRKSGVLIRHIKIASDKVAAECLGVDVKQIRDCEQDEASLLLVKSLAIFCPT